MAYQTINLAALPTPSAVAVWSFASILTATQQDAVARLNAQGVAYNVQTLTANPMNFILSAYAYREGLVLQQINEAVNSTFLATATQLADVTLRAADVNVTPAVGESVASLQQRAMLQWEQLATGGTYGRYMSMALDAAPVDLAGVAVYGAEVSPIPAGEVWIVCLGANASGVPSQATLAAVQKACAARGNRPVNDRVKALSVNPQNYSIDATIYFYAGADQTVALAALKTALMNFTAQQATFGATVGPDDIRGLLRFSMPGVIGNAVVRSPAADVVCNLLSAPICSGVRLVAAPYVRGTA